ncbi:MAG: MBL fold metallo-hydrolase [Patescibacteria group bacterium]
MVITWYGKNCFKLQSGELVIVTDPFVPLRGISHGEKKESGLSPFRGRADVIIRTTTSATSDKRQATSEAFEINYPGEYEVKDISIKGWPLTSLKSETPAYAEATAGRQNPKQPRTAYLVEIDELKIVLLGYLANADEIKDFQEYLEDADIVFMPAGGKPFIETSVAAKLIRQLKPSLIVPTLFDNPKDLKPFLNELGKNDTEPQEKLTVNKKELSKEKLIIGCLKT